MHDRTIPVDAIPCAILIPDTVWACCTLIMRLSMQATNKELVIVSRIGVVFWAVVMGVAQVRLSQANGWLAVHAGLLQTEHTADMQLEHMLLRQCRPCHGGVQQLLLLENVCSASNLTLD